jgi:type I restriction enzyme S subunit
MTTATQKIPSGYKQTEIGVIPTDWDVKKLGDIVQFNNGKAHERFIDDKGDYIVVNSKFISTAGEVFKNSFENLSPLSAGDITMVMSDIPNGKALAKCFFIEKSGKYTLNQRICAFKSNGSDSLYLFYKLNRNKYFLDFDSGVGQTNLKKSEVLNCPVSLPTDKKEQTSIAIALSDADVLIKKLEKLLEKKKNIKQGVMQELLTGKLRLPGFSGKWEVKKLGVVVNVNKGIQKGRAKLTDSGKYPVWNGGVEPSGYSEEWNANENTITISEGGNSCGFVNYCKQKFWLGGHCYAIEIIKNNIDPIFFYQKLKYKETLIMSLRVGSGLPNIQKKNLLSIDFSFPNDKSEQTAIATVLFDMDTEIEKLESQLIKYQNIKQGMMQTLLTGKIRLINNG